MERRHGMWRVWLAAVVLAGTGPAWAQAAAADADDDAVPEAEAVFDFLTAEIAAQRGDVESALAMHLRLARELRDPRVARRAVEMALRARALGPAMDSATLLFELEPESTLAREIISALLANDGDLAKATETLSGMLERMEDRAPMFRQLSYLFGRFPDKAAVLEATRKLASRYDIAEARYAVGVAALLANRPGEAREEADAALAMRPAWEPGAILKAQILRKVAPAEVVPFYQGFVAAHPASLEVRMQLGRELAADRKLAEARGQFREAEKLSKGDGQAAYAIGLLSLQLEDYADARGAFNRALAQGYREPAAVYLGLGQASEGLKEIDEAIGWYQRVESGDWVRAQLKIATLVSRQQGLQAGRDYLRRIEPRSTEDRIQVVQVEAQLLREAKAWKETYETLSEAVRAYPDAYELLYDRAMAAERVGELAVMEADLRKVIRIKPDYAHAYNALGYTLAEKTDRLDEARALIEKALKLAPDDPFILDSMGWVCYRQGQIEEALKHLHQAYVARPDPEIAAHLGEVLWKVGQRDEAQKVWRTALAENPGHESLLAVIQKFRP